MPMDLYHANCCFLPLGDMVFQNIGCLSLLSIMRTCGVSVGCTASIILFLSAINVIIEHISAITEDEIYKTMTSTPVKAFMDDIFLMSPSIPATQVLLDRCSFRPLCSCVDLG